MYRCYYFYISYSLRGVLRESWLTSPVPASPWVYSQGRKLKQINKQIAPAGGGHRGHSQGEEGGGEENKDMLIWEQPITGTQAFLFPSSLR